MMKALVRMNVFSQWKGAVVGALLGMCITYLFLSASTPTLITPLDRIWNGVDNCKPLQQQANPPPTENSIQSISEFNGIINGSDRPLVNNINQRKEVERNFERKRVALLLALWEASSTLSTRSPDDPLLKSANILPSEVPRAPHLENCKEHSIINNRLDVWDENKTWPLWTLWKGQGLGLQMDIHGDTFMEGDMILNKNHTTQSFYPPWVEGADEDNLPFTRRVQADIWQHQHPKNCQDLSLRFLLADWETDPGFGVGAQIASMAGMLAIALNEQRILVSNYFNRADHKECLGSDHAHWSCYFLSETSKECRNRALLLASQSSAWEQGLITGKNNYTSRQIWAGKMPRQWGKPWELMQPTTQINGKLLIHHKASDRRWWRAQAVRYFMRFPTEYMCSLLNMARHNAFGVKAAKMVLDSLPFTWPEVPWVRNETEIDQFVWKTHKPWVPRPLVTIHVRQGDKAQEMKIVNFQDYMKLAQHLRNRFPDARSIWLSTEMQEVIEESKLYSSRWDIYYTNVSRQTGNTSMSAYEASLGRPTSTNYPLVNFLLSADADFFIGALGSTWCYLIDGMRTTGGRVMAGYLSVNKDRFW